MTRTNSKSRSSAGAGAGAGQAGYYPYFTLLFMYLCFTNQLSPLPLGKLASSH